MKGESVEERDEGKEEMKGENVGERDEGLECG